MEDVPIPGGECEITAWTNCIKRNELKYAEYKKQYTEIVLKIQTFKMRIARHKIDLKETKDDHSSGKLCRYCRAKERMLAEQALAQMNELLPTP